MIDQAMVVFTPSGKRGSFPIGTPVLQAARELGGGPGLGLWRTWTVRALPGAVLHRGVFQAQHRLSN